VTEPRVATSGILVDDLTLPIKVVSRISKTPCLSMANSMV